MFFLSIDIFRNSIDLIVQNLNKAIACLEAGECEKELTQEQYKIKKYLVRTILNSLIFKKIIYFWVCRSIRPCSSQPSSLRML
jgi:hypothetical protein